jgi:hypothetical protein
MDANEPLTNSSEDQNPTDALSDSVMDSMAAALESAGISITPDEPAPVPEKRYSDDVMAQVIAMMEINDEDSFVEFAKSMDGDDNGYLNKQELIDAAEAWLHVNQETSGDEETTVEQEVNALLQQGEESSRNNDAKSALAAFNKATVVSFWKPNRMLEVHDRRSKYAWI